MAIRKVFDEKLKVLPVATSMEHRYYYEGPCRFGKGDALKPGYDALANAQAIKGYKEALKTLETDGIEIMEMGTIHRTDDWENEEAQWQALEAPVAEADVAIVKCSIGSDDFAVEFCSRFDIPVIITPDSFASYTEVPAAVRALSNGDDKEIFSVWRWSQIPPILKAIRARKVLKDTRVLCATRWASPTSQSSLDSFNSFEKITAKLGTRFRFVNIHELLDQMTPAEEGGNHTTPGRETLDLTDEDMAEAEKMADELLADAQYVDVDRKYLLKSIYAYLTVRKHMDSKDCNCFACPCPDTCSTRRLNEMQFTFCFNHSLNLEQGIASCCEFDVNTAVTINALMAVSGECAYFGNTEPLTWWDTGNGEVPLVLGGDAGQASVLREKLEAMGDVARPSAFAEGADAVVAGSGSMDGGAADDKKPQFNADGSGIYWMQHSIAHRHMLSNDEDSPYALNHFAWDQKFGATMKVDFDALEGKPLTLARFSPDGEKLFIGKGTAVCGDGYKVPNCSQVLYFRVKNIDSFFEKQTTFGNHIAMVIGDYTEDLIQLAKLLDVEPVLAGF